jgi:glyoxylase-like metal-dependent hydrolase (beta-lactamase superfamily II)
MEASLYLLGGILIDTGFPHVRDLVVRFLSGQSIRAIGCTHHHEDHAGNCGALAEMHGCPVYMAHPDAILEEGIANMPLYRRMFWGQPDRYEPLEMPAEIRVGHRVLRSVPIPGHSRTHTAFFEEATGLLFSGDLYITGGVAAVMTHENPYESIRSLRRAASLSPSRMLTGHGHTVKNPVKLLRAKADRIEKAAERAWELHGACASEQEIVRRIFSKGHAKDRFMALMTGGEFSRLNFVRACIAHRNDPPAPISQDASLLR